MLIKRSLLALALLLATNSLTFSQTPLGRFQSVGELCSIGNMVYFTANDGINGDELWKTDGTEKGTSLVKDINQGYLGSGPSNLTVFNNELFFSANDGVHGNELWKSDGTDAGTVLLKNIKPEVTVDNNISSDPRDFRILNNQLYFLASDEWTREDIWKTDGTINGTIKSVELNFTDISDFTVAGNSLFYVQIYGPEKLMITDGTTGGTHQIYIDDFYSIEELINVGDKLFFITSTTYRQQFRLYSLDPESETFTLLHEYDAVQYGSNDITNMEAVNGKLFYSIQTDNNTNNSSDVLWKSDGTVAGTDTVRSFTYDPYLTNNQMTDFICYQNQLFFRGRNGYDYTFYKSDGTYEGTSIVKPISLYYDGPHFIVCGNLLYFEGYGSNYTKVIYKSDGTASGTEPFNAVYEGLLNIPPKRFEGQGILYYTGDDGSGQGLWNETPAPEIKVSISSTNLESGNQLNFSTTISHTIDEKTLTVKNCGLDDLFISEVQVSGNEFFIDDLSRVIPPGESKTLTISYFPVIVGQQSGKLRIYTNDATEGCFELLLNGIANEVGLAAGILDDNISLKRFRGTTSDMDTIKLDNCFIEENKPAGTIVGNLSVRINPTYNYTYSLVQGTGDNDNNTFYITGNKLFTSAAFDFEYKNTYTIRVKATYNNQSFENFLLIRVTDLNEQSATACENRFYSLGYSINDVDFVTDNIVYTVGDNGKILRSDDYGNHWSIINSGTDQDLFHIQFVSDQTGYILGGYYKNTILKTENGGGNWFPVDFDGPQYPQCSNFYFVNEQNGFVIGQQGMVFRTDDGGRSWTFQKIGDYSLSSMCFISEQTGFICGANNSLYRTDDGGNSWTTVEISSAGYYVTLADICFASEQVGYIISDNGKIFKSTDSGQTWSIVYETYQSGLRRIYFVTENIGFVVGNNGIATILKTYNGGSSWVSISDLGLGELMSIAMNSSGSRGCITGNGSGYGSSYDGRVILWSDDNGNSWLYNTCLYGNSNFNDIKFFNDSTGYLISDYGSAMKTQNGGISWQTSAMTYLDIYVESHFLSKDTIVVVNNSNVQLTLNGGESWNILSNFPGRCHYCFIDLNHIFYCENGKIYKSDNGGQSWTMIHDEGYMYVSKMTHYGNNTINVLGMDVIITSKDGGASWTSYNLQESPFTLKSIFYIDENNIMVAGAKGMLLKSVDGGLTWERLFSAMKQDIVDLSFYDELNGVALTNYDGSGALLFRTYDGGYSWIPLNYSLGYGVKFCTLEDDIYICGSGCTILKYSQGLSPSSAGYISGSNTACVNTTSEFTATSLPFGEYHWFVEPEQKISYKDNKASIFWSEPGSYLVKAVPENGCGAGEPQYIQVDVPEMPDAIITGDDNVVQNAVNVEYVSNAGLYTIVNWQIFGEQSVNLLDDTKISVNWSSLPSGEVNLIHTSTINGCRQLDNMVVIINGPVGIEEELKQMNIQVYPNPASGNLFIKTGNDTGGIAVTVYSGTGKRILYQEFPGGGENVLNIKDLSSGVYVLEINDGREKISVQIIKK